MSGAGARFRGGHRRSGGVRGPDGRRTGTEARRVKETDRQPQSTNYIGVRGVSLDSALTGREVAGSA
jgi:hypothetical protein